MPRYSADPNCAEVDHAELLDRLNRNYVGWALSTSSPALPMVLALATERSAQVRVGGWFKPFASFKPGVNPGYCWEPVLFVPSPRKRSRLEATVRDYYEGPDPLLLEKLLADASDSVRANITLKKGLSGAKPEAFCRWMIDLLGLEPEDVLDDLYPGTGIMGRVWEQWKRERAA